MKTAIRFKSLNIKNGRIFKDLSLPLENQGIVAVQGQNGSGKSTIWSFLQVPFYSSTPNGARRDELTKNKKDSSSEVLYDRNDVPHSVSYGRTKGKWKHTITKNGDDITPHDSRDSIKAAKDLLGLSKEEFEGSVHLTQNSSHLLISGKPSQRKQYISDFFNLDSRFDQVLESAKQKLAVVSREIDKVSALSQSKQVLEEEIKNYSLRDTTEFEEKRKNLEENIVKQSTILASLKQEKDNLNLYLRLIESASAFENPENLIAELEKKVIELKSSFQTAEMIRKQNENITANNSRIDNLNRQISAIIEEFPTLNEQDLSQERLNSLSVLKSSYSRVYSFLQELEGLPSVEDVDLAYLEAELQKVKLEKSVWDRKVSAIEKGECSECGSTFDSSKIEEVREKAVSWEKVATVMENEVAAAKQTKLIFERRKYVESMVQGVQIFTSEMNAELENLERLLPKKEELKRLKATLGSIDYMSPLEEIDTQQTISQISSLESNLISARTCLDAKSKLPEQPKRSVGEIDEDISIVETDTRELNSTRDILVAEIGQIDFANRRYQNLASQISEIEKKLETIDKLKADEYFWKSLCDAYGPKGLRVRQLEKIMDLVLQTLPYYTNILFQEKGLQFRHKCDAGNVEVLAKRTEVIKGKEETFEHDISSFSGGEQKRLSIAFVLTLAECVPLSKRTNLLVLDEIDANLDSDGQYRFINDLLPALKGKYESIFVISHAEEIQASAVYDKVWMVTKENHQSTVEIYEAS